MKFPKLLFIPYPILDEPLVKLPSTIIAREAAK
jgi:hypothetical protein